MWNVAKPLFEVRAQHIRVLVGNEDRFRPCRYLARETECRSSPQILDRRVLSEQARIRGGAVRGWGQRNVITDGFVSTESFQRLHKIVTDIVAEPPLVALSRASKEKPRGIRPAWLINAPHPTRVVVRELRLQVDPHQLQFTYQTVRSPGCSM